MRYWAYFAGKVVVAAAPLVGLYRFVFWAFPPHLARPGILDLGQASEDFPFALAMMTWFLLAVATLYIIGRDQRRRCRVCLRKLMMPIETGSRGFTLQLGIPKVESICPYGHGTLREDDLSGVRAAEWTPHSDNLWDELCAPGKESGQDQ